MKFIRLLSIGLLSVTMLILSLLEAPITSNASSIQDILELGFEAQRDTLILGNDFSFSFEQKLYNVVIDEQIMADDLVIYHGHLRDAQNFVSLSISPDTIIISVTFDEYSLFSASSTEGITQNINYLHDDGEPLIPSLTSKETPVSSDLFLNQTQQALMRRSLDIYSSMDLPNGTEAIIDVMVPYTSEARAHIGGTSNIQAEIATTIAEANAIYANTDIDITLNLVHTYESAYSQSVDGIEADLNNITYYNAYSIFGLIDEIYLKESIYKPDLISLWTYRTSSPYCGIAWQMDSPNVTFRDYAFSVVDISCARSNQSFVHELAHNMGARHDRYISAFELSYCYDNNNNGTIEECTIHKNEPEGINYGFVDLPNSFRTIMSYNTECSDRGIYCTRIPYFSSSDTVNHTYLSHPIGNNQNSNSSHIQSTRDEVMNFKDTLTPAEIHAEFDTNTYTPDIGETVDYLDLSNTNPVNWLWNFGDGSTSTLQYPTHEYTTEGIYTVSLTVGVSSNTETVTHTDLITVGTEPTITTQPAGGNLLKGQTLMLQVEATGSNLQYQWYKYGSAISGETTNSITLSYDTVNSGNYSVRVSNNLGIENSQEVHVYFREPLEANSLFPDNPVTIAVGTSFSEQWAIGDTAPYTTSILSGSFPTGISFGSDARLLTGTPTKIGEYPIEIKISDGYGQSYTLTIEFNITSNTSLTSGTLIKIKGNPTVFFLENYELYGFRTQTEFLSNDFDWDSIIEVDSLHDLEIYREGGFVKIQNGTLVMEPGSPLVYLIQNGKKYPFNSPDVFLGLGYNWNAIYTVIAGELANYDNGELMTVSELHFPDTKVKTATNPLVYQLQDDGSGTLVKRPIPSPGVFFSQGWRWEDVIVVSNTELSHYPDGDVLPYRDGSLVQSENGGAIYVIEFGKKRQISRDNIAYFGYRMEALIIATQTELDFIPNGEGIHSN